MEAYTSLAPYYEALNDSVDYDGYVSFVLRALAQYGRGDTQLLLDLACGTGALTRRLIAAGYDTIGVDLSADMLAVAIERASEDGLSPLFLQQDMRSFELYGTVGAVVCGLDSINYLQSTRDVAACFATVHNYLEPNGVFVFDVNTPYKFETVYGQQDYVLEADGVVCTWQNDYNPRTGKCKFYLSFFVEEADGRYTRLTEEQTERCYRERTLRKLLVEAGFEVCAVVGDMDMSPCTPTTERAYYICRCRKEEEKG